MHCTHCGKSGPDGVFCTFCGANQATAGVDPGDPKGRSGHYAAYPGEAVSHPSVFTTLFPHLGHHKVHDFRLAFFAGVAVLFLLVIAGLIGAAIVAAAFLVPVLYLVYLYEAQVYRDEPAVVIGVTVGGGIILGLVVTIAANALLGSTPGARPNAISGIVINVGALMLVGVLVPLVQEIVKPLPALFLRSRPAFSETADGLVFGVAAGLGFALAETLVNFSSVLTDSSMRSDSGTWIYTLVSLAIFTPLLQGSAAGAITAALWRRNRGAMGVGIIAAAVLIHVAFTTGTQLLQASGQTQLVWLGWQALLVGLLLVAIRHLLHNALLEEAGHMGLTPTICPDCQAHVTAAGFCPHCGRAMSAVPRTAKKIAAGTAREGA